MLSDFLTSSYLQYKADTDAVASWLMATARNRGFPVDTLGGSPTTTSSSSMIPQQSSKRLKGKARKLARETTSKPAPPPSTKSHRPKHTIALKDFVKLADYIAAATDPPVHIPASFVAVLNRAISVRRNHGLQVTMNFPPDVQSQASSDRHNYFIGILEHVQQALRPRMLSDQVNDPVTQLLGRVSTDNMIRNLANRFDGLDVQEPSEAFLQAPEVPLPTATDGKSEVNYEAEQMQDFEEACFGFNLLLHDFGNLRTVIVRTWKGYQLGLFDLVSASLMMNSAIDIAQRMQDDVQQLFDRYGGGAKMLSAFYAALCQEEGEDPDFREHTGDDMNFQTYDIAQSLLLPTFMVLYSFSCLVGKDNFLPYKPGYFGTFDRASNRSEKSARDKYLEDKIILMEILSEFLTLHRISSPQPFEDEFIHQEKSQFPLQSPN